MSERKNIYMKNILVTGGAGFIGSHTVVELVAAGYNPVIIDNFSNSEQMMLDGIEKILGFKPKFYEHDCRDSEFLKKILREDSIDGVIHFAALKSVGDSLKQPLAYYQNNIVGLLSLLEAMEACSISNLIFSSSATVYGEPDTLPITEKSRLKTATSPYGITKQMGEQIIEDVTHASKTLRSVSLRYFNPIGAHESALIGELPKGTPANLIPFLTQAVAGLRGELVVHGNDYPTPDGSCIRDYIHVVDLAKAHIKGLEFIDTQSPSFYDTCNIGTGKGASVLEVLKTFESVTGKKVPYKIGPRRDGDIIQSYASVEKAQKLLGWKAEKSLGDGLADAWHWQESLASRA